MQRSIRTAVLEEVEPHVSDILPWDMPGFVE
jgi:hypothetical protein